MQGLDTIADALGDPNLKDQIQRRSAMPEIGRRMLLGISIVTIIARLRSARKAN